MKKQITYAALLTCVSLVATTANAQDYIITHQHNKFTPKDLVIPADQKVKVIVKNLDAKPMEFESAELKREKVISGNSEATVYLGPLAAGNYQYFNEFNEGVTGTITAKPSAPVSQ